MGTSYMLSNSKWEIFNAVKYVQRMHHFQNEITQRNTSVLYKRPPALGSNQLLIWFCALGRFQLLFLSRCRNLIEFDCGLWKHSAVRIRAATQKPIYIP